MKKPMKKLIIWLLSIALVFGGCIIYVCDYYHADDDAILLLTADRSVEPFELSKGVLVFQPESPSAGFIFYPGGKVEHTAYIPLMQACAEEGIACVLVEMPFRLAVLDINAAEGIQEQYPQVEDWYIGGHSLGGSMAASYLEKNLDAYEGLILLGSYSTADLSQSDLAVLSIFGSEDMVMNREKYDNSKTNLPEGFTEVILEGGCHAYFGMYGAQNGDGTPTISNEDQIYMTAEYIAGYVDVFHTVQ
jgi:hypothetical protein